MQSSLKRLLFICFCISACAVNDQQQESSKAPSTSTVDTIPIQNKKAQTVSDTLTINSKAAVFYAPDSARLDSLFMANGESDMRIGADDYLYYLDESANFLKPFVPVIQADDKKYLRFIAANKNATLIRLDTLPHYWGIFFFDGIKAPKRIDMTLIEEEYKNYYQ